MRKAKSHNNDTNNELRKEYSKSDLGKGVRGKFLESYAEGTNLVLLTPEVAKVFTTDEAVNEALRSLIEVAKHHEPTKGTRKATARKPKKAVG